MQISTEALIPLYLAFAAKHLLCDYVFQSSRMASMKGRETGWLQPLATHAGTHAAGTLAIALVAAPALWWLALVDLLVHGAIDRTKSVATRGWTIGERRFWWAFGLDQTAHQLTHFGFLLAMLSIL